MTASFLPFPSRSFGFWLFSLLLTRVCAWTREPPPRTIVLQILFRYGHRLMVESKAEAAQQIGLSIWRESTGQVARGVGQPAEFSRRRSIPSRTSIPGFAPSISLTLAYMRNWPETSPAAGVHVQRSVVSLRTRAGSSKLTHHHPRTEPSEKASEARLARERREPGEHRASRSMALVDLREEGVSRLSHIISDNSGGRGRGTKHEREK